MKYIDVHAHLAEEGYEIPAELEKIRAAGVDRVILAGDTLSHSRMHAEIARENEGVFFTAGVHPSETEGFGKETTEALRILCREEKCVAVGEIGLDYHYPDTDKKKQREAFIAQILLAHEVGLPVQIHSRDCAADTLAIVTEMHEYMGHGWLLHCYSHGAEMIDRFASLGAYFSYGGVCCFKNAKKAVESVRHTPMDRLLSETDSPYLSPYRGEKNTSANIPVIVGKLAEIVGEEENRLREVIADNAKRLFAKLK